MATKYIAPAPTGNNSNAGTLASPWLTLAYAYTNTSAGDTIYFLPGTHTWLTATMTNRTFQGASALTTFVNAGSYAAKVRWLLGGTFIVNDLTFTMNGRDDNDATSSLLSDTGTSSVITFNRCIFTDLVVGGPFANSQTGSAGIFASVDASTCQLTFNACLFYNIRHNSVSIASYLVTCHNVAPGGGAGILNLKNCTIYLNASGANKLSYVFGTWSAHIGVPILTNCIIENASGGTMTWQSSTSGNPTLSYCDYYLMTGTVSASNSITTSPQLVDPLNANFRLRPTSPCIDTGTVV